MDGLFHGKSQKNRWFGGIITPFQEACKWRFPEIGVPTVISRFNGMFPYRSAIFDTPMTMETSWNRANPNGNGSPPSRPRPWLGAPCRTSSPQVSSWKRSTYAQKKKEAGNDLSCVSRRGAGWVAGGCWDCYGLLWIIMGLLWDSQMDIIVAGYSYHGSFQKFPISETQQ